MCRWLAYTGNALAIEEFVFAPDYSLIDQSMSSRMTINPTNGDGFGVGWYGGDGSPGVYRGVQPAWNDENLRDLTHHIRSRIFMAHVRRSTGTAVQQTNCHPFRHGRWLFVHNGSISEFDVIRRELLLMVDRTFFPAIRGSTDSELMFHLALTFGLEEDPLRAVEEMAGLVEKLGHEAGVENPLQMTLGISNGEDVYAVRYSSQGDTRTLFHSTDVAAIRALYPDHPRIDVVEEGAWLITSEPTTELAGIFEPVPESSAIVVSGGRLESRPFAPRPPQ